MHSTFVAIAERALRLWMSKERADSIVGDLTEVAPQKGIGWFWFSLLKIILFLAWRPALGMISGLYAGSWALGKFGAIILGLHGAHRPPTSWIAVFAVISGATVVLIWVLPYAILRYGLRERITALAACWAGVLTLFLCEWYRPAVLAVSLVLVLGLAGFGLSKREFRRPSISLLAIVAIAIGGFLAITALVPFWQYVVHPGLWAEAEAYRSFVWSTEIAGVLLALTAVCMIGVLFARLRTWSSRNVPE